MTEFQYKEWYESKEFRAQYEKPCDDLGVTYTKEATKFINELAQNKIKVDCVILDPPRSGTTYNFISAIAKMGIKRVVYVSCGPETLARDLKLFKDFGYEIKNVKCVDMFPKTEHVECVVLLNIVKK